jgi:hypothetical protein
MALTTEKMERLRILILGDKTATHIDETLQAIAEITEPRFNKLIGKYSQKSEEDARSDSEELWWILEEVIIRRYNRIGSEGLKAESVDGHSVTFDDADDFAQFEPLIADHFKKDVTGKERPGKVAIF